MSHQAWQLVITEVVPANTKWQANCLYWGGHVERDELGEFVDISTLVNASSQRLMYLTPRTEKK